MSLNKETKDTTAMQTMLTPNNNNMSVHSMSNMTSMQSPDTTIHHNMNQTWSPATTPIVHTPIQHHTMQINTDQELVTPPPNVQYIPDNSYVPNLSISPNTGNNNNIDTPDSLHSVHFGTPYNMKSPHPVNIIAPSPIRLTRLNMLELEERSPSMIHIPIQEEDHELPASIHNARTTTSTPIPDAVVLSDLNESTEPKVLKPFGGLVRKNTVLYEPPQYKPFFTVSVLIVNFLISLSYSSWTLVDSKQNPTYGPSQNSLLKMGAKYGPNILDGEWYRLIASSFLHSGLIHFFISMIGIGITSWYIERTYGMIRTCAIYMCTSIIGTILSAVFIPNVITVGASGACFGFLGVLLADFILFHRYQEPARKWYYACFLLLCCVIGIILGFLPLIDNISHLFALFAGLLCGCIVLYDMKRDPEGAKPVMNRTFLYVPIIILSIMYIAGLAVLYGNRERNEWCQACTAFDCIPTSMWSCSNSFVHIKA